MNLRRSGFYSKWFKSGIDHPAIFLGIIAKVLKVLCHIKSGQGEMLLKTIKVEYVLTTGLFDKILEKSKVTLKINLEVILRL